MGALSQALVSINSLLGPDLSDLPLCCDKTVLLFFLENYFLITSIGVVWYSFDLGLTAELLAAMILRP